MELSVALVTIKCRNPQTLGAFYEEKIGLKLLSSGEHAAILDCGGVSVMLSDATGGQTDCLQLETGGIDEAVKELKSRGVVFDELEIGLRPDGSTAKGAIGETYWGRYAHLRDPEGNLLVLAEHDEEWFPYLPKWLSERGG